MLRRVALLIVALPLCAGAKESVCYGTTSKGRLEHGAQLPQAGSNFGPYSSIGVGAGRTYVHSIVAPVVAAAYSTLAKTQPDKTFLYGESGWPDGGRIKPHRTHQNGLAVDFMVPVLSSKGRAVPLPTSAFNKFGYAIEFDTAGRYEELTIDFEAIAEHLYALHAAAKKNGIGIARVIFEPAYMPMLHRTKRGKFIRNNLHFMPGHAWIRHDEHYHVDFSVTCKPYKRKL